MNEVIKNKMNITVIDTKYEMKAMLVLDVSAKGKLQHFRVAGEGTNNLELYESGNAFPIRASHEISTIYVDVEYQRNGFVTIFIRACYDRDLLNIERKKS